MKYALALLAALAALPAAAEVPDRVARAEILPGWRDGNGLHTSALRIVLAPGWKTYWRAPGDAGIPPSLDFSGSRNVAGVAPHWPVPHVFDQNGLRSVGYADEVVVPLTVRLAEPGASAQLSGTLEIGVCETVCIPVSLDIAAALEAPGAADGRIEAALADQPISAGAAGVTAVTCRVEPISDGLRMTAEIAMPALGGTEFAVIETADPAVWVSEAAVERRGGMLLATADLVPPSAKPFLVDRSGIRVTVLAGSRAVDIRGCTGG